MKNRKSSVVVVRKQSGHKSGHHGGSWKLPYADFMTSMMAFFMVMWLLSSSTPSQRQGIAEYFKTPLNISVLAHGNKNSLSDNSVIPGGGPDALRQDGEIKKNTLNKMNNKGKAGLKDAESNLKKMQGKIEGMIETDPRLNNFSSNLRLSVTDNGLLVQITDSQDRPMFKVGSKIPESYMVYILRALVPVLNELPNRISMSGHTDSLPYTNGEVGYSNWELSTDRANAARQILVNNGLASDKFLRVIGRADTQSQPGSRRDDPINRRISILVLSPEKEKEILQEDVLLNSTVPVLNKALPATPSVPKNNAVVSPIENIIQERVK